MPLYTVQVTVRVEAHSERQAYHLIDRHFHPLTLRSPVEHLDSEVVDIASDEPPDTSEATN